MTRSVNALLFILLLSGAAFQTGCGDDALSAPTEDEAPALPVETAAVQAGEISAFFSGTATLTAAQETDVVAKSGGIVSSIAAEEGQYVRKGAILAQLDDERLALEVTRAETDLNRLLRERDRNDEMFERQLISAEENDRSRSAYDAQKAAYDLAKLALEHTTVRSPISGVVSSRMI
ncbi:MAG: membrane fusion protein (multidrug efflux system), partial [Rhodothermales bacterium]